MEDEVMKKRIENNIKENIAISNIMREIENNDTKVKYILKPACAFLIAIVVFIGLKSQDLQNEMLITKNNVLSDTTKVDTTEKYEKYSFVTDQMKNESENATISALFNEEIKPENLKDNSDNIAIVRIISLDSSSAEYDHIVGKTYGKLLINTIIKGNLKEGEVIEYASTGGYLTIAEWEKYQPQSANEKRDYLREKNSLQIDKNTTYMHLQFGKCIDVEAGNTYLAYFNYNEEMEKYEMIGFQNGLMKLDIPQEEKSISIIDINYDELKVLNNNTGEYENLKEYIIMNINK